MPTENSKERIRIRYEVAALQGLTANPEIFKTLENNSEYIDCICSLAKKIAADMIELNNQ